MEQYDQTSVENIAGFTNHLDLIHSTDDLGMATTVGQQNVIPNHHDLSVT